MGVVIMSDDRCDNYDCSLCYRVVRPSAECQQGNHMTAPEGLSMGIIKFKKLDPHAVIPTRSSAGAAGFDLYTTSTALVMPNQVKSLDTHLAVAIPPGYVGLVRPRSGLAFRHAIDVMAGVIDSDYRGEIMVLIRNDGDKPLAINHSDRIAQLVVVPCLLQSEEVNDLDGTERGADGFGSSGR
jgi:dUTP pyrophosphatase